MAVEMIGEELLAERDRLRFARAIEAGTLPRILVASKSGWKPGKWVA